MSIEELYEKIGFSEYGEKFLRTREKKRVRLVFFVSNYGDTDLTYERLISIALSGWVDIFDEWKEKGILN